MKKVKMNFLWNDRRRRMGLPLSFTRYALTEDRLFLDTGFFNLRSEEILLYRVRDINLRRSLWQRIFGVGKRRQPAERFGKRIRTVRMENIESV